MKKPKDNRPQKPCEKCKKRKCLDICYPYSDWLRAMRKRGLKP